MSSTPVLKKSLIIGIPDSGKTHLAGQLFGRAENGKFTLKLRYQPTDISIFKEILQKLSDGKSASHTSVGFHEAITLPLESKDGKEFDLIYPDYGGEQIINMVKNRKISNQWQNAVMESTEWLLLIRADRIERPLDLLSNFYKRAISNGKTPHSLFKGIPENTSPFYIELFQMLLWNRGKFVEGDQGMPNLSVLLTFWDKLNDKHILPKTFLKEKLPLFQSYIEHHWKKNYKVLGLSSTGKTLSENEPDEEYQIKGPHQFGYWVSSDGQKDTDLTKLLLFDR